MTDAEIQPYLNKTVRATLADGRVLVGKLETGHNHYAYVLSTAPVDTGDHLHEHIQSGGQINELEDLTGTPEAIEGK